MWTFGALFVLLGLPLLFLDRDNPDKTIAMPLAGLATLSLSGFAFCLVWHSWLNGTIDIQHFTYSRAHQPLRYMATLLLILMAGFGTLISAVWFLFFK